MVLLVFVIINGAVYIQTQKVIQNEINRTNAGLLKQIQQSIDVGLHDIDTLMFQVSMNENLRRMVTWNKADVSKVIFTPEYYTVVETMHDLARYKNVNGFVIGMYVYLKNSDQILSPFGFLDPETFYKATMDNPDYHEGMTYTKWHDNLNSIHNKKWILDKDTKIKLNENRYTVKMLQTLPINTVGKTDSTLVFVLNKERFMNAINNISSMYNGWTLILDKENQPLFTNVPFEMSWSPDYNSLTGKTGLINEDINGEKVLISYINSEISDWKYVSVFPFNLYQEKVVYARNFMASSIIISVIIGMLLAYYFSRRNYYPVNELVNIINKRFGDFRSVKYDEYRFIKEAVNTTMDENEKIRMSLRQQDAVLRTNFLYKLLMGKIENETFIRNAFKKYQLNFCSDHFAVMLFYITDFSRLFPDTDKTYEEKMEFVQFILANVIEELASQNNVGYMIESDDMPVCLINFKEENLTSGKQDMIRIVDNARSFVSMKFNIDFMVSISSVHDTVFGIPEAYREALDVMEYKTVMGNDNILVYEDIKNAQYDYYYSIENEYQLINFIKTGDVEAAEKILNNVFENTLKAGKLSINIVKCLMFDLASTILKAMNEVDDVQRNLLFESIDFPGRLLACEKITDMRQYMTHIMEVICSDMRLNKSSKKYEFIVDVISFIEGNYTDFNFCVSSLAEKFKLTPSYLARMFKEHTGKGILEFINNCRMEKAKQFLKEDELSIKDIAVKVGYYNINAFNRMFKKNEGITPGMYKDNN